MQGELTHTMVCTSGSTQLPGICLPLDVSYLMSHVVLQRMSMWADLKEVWRESQRVLPQGPLPPLDGVSSLMLPPLDLHFFRLKVLSCLSDLIPLSFSPPQLRAAFRPPRLDHRPLWEGGALHHRLLRWRHRQRHLPVLHPGCAPCLRLSGGRLGPHEGGLVALDLLNARRTHTLVGQRGAVKHAGDCDSGGCSSTLSRRGGEARRNQRLLGAVTWTGTVLA